MSEEKTTRGKADSSEMQKRINTIYLMLLQGSVRKEVVQYSSETSYIGICSVRAYRQSYNNRITAIKQ